LHEPGFVGEHDRLDAVAQAERAQQPVMWALTVPSLRNQAGLQAAWELYLWL
jgi:hypothetical protein